MTGQLLASELHGFYHRCQSEDLGMQMLWAAEIQARQFGVRGSTDPFDHAQLPLLATMQFDGFMHKGRTK